MGDVDDEEGKTVLIIYAALEGFWGCTDYLGRCGAVAPQRLSFLSTLQAESCPAQN